MGHPHETVDLPFSHADYLSWPENERWELIDGRAYEWSPPPGRDKLDPIPAGAPLVALAGACTAHQQIVAGLSAWLRAALRGGRCRHFTAPYDVLLTSATTGASPTPGGDRVVQPDVLVTCDPSKITPRGLAGAPDFVIEVVSPGTRRFDLTVKAALYAAHGVAEYWTIDPEPQSAAQTGPHLRIRTLQPDGTYDMGVRELPATGTVEVGAVAELVIDLDEVFAQVG